MTTPSPLTPTEHVREFNVVYKFVRRKMPTNLLMPLGIKNPLYKHARGEWNWERLENHYKQTGFEVDTRVGILLIDLAVLDLDSLEEVSRWENEWPMLNNVPMETTSKGKHYFFMRTRLCDELRLTDGPLSKTADFKSITATGTAGAIMFVGLCAVIALCKSHSTAAKHSTQFNVVWG